jgi:polysaccharide biosynthesis protein PelA
MRLINLFLLLLPSVLIPRMFAATGKANVLVCYGRLQPETVKGYNCVIVEQEHYTPAEVRILKAQNEKVLAYISLGEVNAHAKHYAELKDNTLGKNDTWNSYYLDLTAEKTTAALMKIIGDAINQGYDGFFLDNFDNYGSWGKQSAQKQALIALLKQINNKYPHYTFLQNAGLDLIADTAAYVDGVIVESVATDYSFAGKTYKLREDADFNARAIKLAAVSQTYSLPVMLIEYADTKILRDAAEKRIKRLGFDYFIGQIDLQAVPQFKP